MAKYNPEAVNVELIKETDNQNDTNAVSVNVSVNESKSYKLGYLPKDLAQYISRLIDNGVRLITSFKGVTGGTAEKYYYGALIEIQF